MPRKGPGRTGNLDTQLRKWVLKSDITKIRKLIMDGANPNFISQQVPDSKSTNEHYNALGIACMSKKPFDTIKAIIDVSATKKIKMDFVPKDRRILNDDNQTKESVLHTACIKISSPAKLCQVIELLGEQDGVDFNYTAWHNMSPIAFLLHEDAFIADPREPLKKLLEHGCNPNTKCYVESEAEPNSEYDDEEDEGFVCPDNTYKYPSALKPETFERSIGYIFPELNNCTPPKWRKKAQVEEGVQTLLADFRKKFTIKNKTKMKESQKEFWSKLENQEYLENYRQSLKNKRTDEPKKISDRHWGELYNLTLEKESPDKDPHKNKLDPSDQKYNLKTRKKRQAANKIALLFDQDCECCMQRMKQDESSPVTKENQKTVLEKVLELGDSSKSQSQSPANHSVKSQPKTRSESKPDTPKFRKNKTPKKSRQNTQEKTSFEPIISKCFHCDKESSKEIPLQRCSACNRINYCSRDCQRNDWTRHKVECKEWQVKKEEMLKKEVIELTSDDTDPIESDQSDSINQSRSCSKKTTKKTPERRKAIKLNRVLDESQSEKKDGSESVNSSLSQSEDSTNQKADQAPKKSKIEPATVVDVTSPPPVIYHPINPPIPMIQSNVNQRQLQIQAKINDIFKPVASKSSNPQKSIEDLIVIENEPKKSTNTDVILLSSDDETEKKRQRKRLSDTANFPTSKKRKSDGKSSTSFRDLKENIRKDKQFSNGLSFLDRLDDVRRKDKDTSEDIYQVNKFYEKLIRKLQEASDTR